MTTKQELKGDWNTVAGTVKEKYGQISDQELKQVEGNMDQLIGLIQRKSGQSREQVEAYVESLCSGEGTVADQVSQYAQSAGQAVRAGYQQASSSAREGYQQTSDAVAHRPMESVFAAFGVGLVTGIAIGLSIAAQRRPEPTWRDRFSR